MEDQKKSTVDGPNEATAEKQPKEESQNEDDELNDLLESALKDFSGKTSTSAKVDNVKKENPSESKDEGARKQVNVDDIFQNFVEKDPELSKQWSKLAESCQKAANAKTDHEFEESLSETLKNLADNAKSFAENPNFSDEEMSRMWNNLASEGIDLGNLGNPAEGGLPDVMPLVANMMQNLLSKEVLYPALKDLTAKYPEWLDQNKDTLPSTDLQRFSRQLELMRIVCSEFESETSSDSEDVKTERFKKIMSIMQEMQQCGSPPQDLVGDTGDSESPMGNLDFSKLPGFPNTDNSAAGCVVM